jgi:peptidoglycan/xylan/chitin deacetylase (PgdA/CDA1 family)
MIYGIPACAVFLAAALGSARWTWWRKTASGLPVLAYNKVGTPPAGSRLKDSWVPPEKFRLQIAWLLGGGYSPVFFSELLKAEKTGRELPGKPVLITFEGAYETNYSCAYRILRELGAKGNMFTAFNFIGKADLWRDTAEEPWINMATLEMLGEMRDSGVMEFGSHAMSHPDLSVMPPGDAFWEMAESKKQLEAALGVEISAFAYPFGACSPAIRELALKAGYALDFGSKRGKAAWPGRGGAAPMDRLFVRRSDTKLDLALSLSRGGSRLF